MEELLQKLTRIEKAIQSQKNDGKGLGDFITEKEAMKLLDKGATWFWNKRQSGELTGKKAGNSWYYKQSDILKFIENGKSQAN
jgi:hypothetical protein